MRFRVISPFLFFRVQNRLHDKALRSRPEYPSQTYESGDGLSNEVKDIVCVYELGDASGALVFGTC